MFPHMPRGIVFTQRCFVVSFIEDGAVVLGLFYQTVYEQAQRKSGRYIFKGKTIILSYKNG